MRLIYNTTFHVEDNIASGLIKAIREFYIPYVKAKGLCSDILFTRVIVHEEEGKSFSLQLIFPSEENYATFIDLYKDRLLGILVELFGQKLLHFCTTLEEIVEG